MDSLITCLDLSTIITVYFWEHTMIFLESYLYFEKHKVIQYYSAIINNIIP